MDLVLAVFITTREAKLSTPSNQQALAIGMYIQASAHTSSQLVPTAPSSLNVRHEEMRAESFTLRKYQSGLNRQRNTSYTSYSTAVSERWHSCLSADMSVLLLLLKAYLNIKRSYRHGFCFGLMSSLHNLNLLPAPACVDPNLSRECLLRLVSHVIGLTMGIYIWKARRSVTVVVSSNFRLHRGIF